MRMKLKKELKNDERTCKKERMRKKVKHIKWSELYLYILLIIFIKFSSQIQFSFYYKNGRI